MKKISKEFKVKHLGKNVEIRPLDCLKNLSVVKL